MNRHRHIKQLLFRYGNFLKVSDERYRHATTKHHAGCKQGCFECCATGFFDITLLDALSLHEALWQVPARTRNHITGKANAQLDLLEQRKVFSRRSPLLRSVPAIHALSRKSADLACPCLDDQGACMMYEHRPHICRIFGPTIRGMHRKVWLKGCRHVTTEIPEEDFGMVDMFVEEINMKKEFFEIAGRKGIPDIDTIIPAAIALDPGNWI